MAVRQTNISVSTAGALRGIHYSDIPPAPNRDRSAQADQRCNAV